MNEILLSGCDWKLTGWYRNQWRSKTSMELNMTILPTIPLMNATVPGTIQKDLMENGWLKDLNIGLQSLDAEWVNNREWILEKKFCVEPDWVHDRCELVFEGLDYNGEVYLNGSKVVGFEGMFKPVTIDVTEKLVTGEKENLLEVGR